MTQNYQTWLNEDTLVQQTTADYLSDNLGWDLLLPRLMGGAIDPIRYDKLSNRVEV